MVGNLKTMSFFHLPHSGMNKKDEQPVLLFNDYYGLSNNDIERPWEKTKVGLNNFKGLVEKEIDSMKKDGLVQAPEEMIKTIAGVMGCAKKRECPIPWES